MLCGLKNASQWHLLREKTTTRNIIAPTQTCHYITSTLLRGQRQWKFSDRRLHTSESLAICAWVLALSVSWSLWCLFCACAAGVAFIFQSPKSRCHPDDGERQIVVAADRRQVEGVSAPRCPADGKWGHYVLLCSFPYPPRPRSLTFIIITVLQRCTRSVTKISSVCRWNNIMSTGVFV